MSIFNRIFQRGRGDQDEDADSVSSDEGDVKEKGDPRGEQEGEDDTLVWPEEETTPTRVEPAREGSDPFDHIATAPAAPSKPIAEPPAAEPPAAEPPAPVPTARPDRKASIDAAPSPRPPAQRLASGSAPRTSQPAQRAGTSSSSRAPSQAGAPAPAKSGAPARPRPHESSASARAPSTPPPPPEAVGAGERASPSATSPSPRQPAAPQPRPRTQPSETSTAAREPRSRERGRNGRPKPDTIDSVIAELQEPTGEPKPAAAVRSHEADRLVVGELFEELAVHYMVQLRDFMLEVRWGRALTEWIAGCEPVVRSLRQMAEQVERDDLVGPLDALLAELGKARSAGSVLDGSAKDALLRAYQPLIDAIPKAFALDAEKARREPIIVRATLQQIEGVEKLTLDKLQAAGVMTIDALGEASPRDLADAAGISAELAGKIRDRFRAYRSEATASVAAPSRSGEIRVLAEHLKALEATHRDHEEAARKWSREAKQLKRAARRRRAEALLRVHVSLARLGEVELIIGLDRLPFDKKIQSLAGYLRKEESRQKHG
jgi:hypothetical protein